MEYGNQYTQESERLRIIDLRNRGKSITEICEIVGRSTSTVKRVLREYAISDKLAGNKGPACEKCGASIIAGSKFCNMCGASVLTSAQVCAHNLLKMRNECVKYLPQQMRDAADSVMMEAVNLLNGGQNA